MEGSWPGGWAAHLEAAACPIVVTPQQANRASCRVLEKAGYKLKWAGLLDADDPADAATAVLYVRRPYDPRVSVPERRDSVVAPGAGPATGVSASPTLAVRYSLGRRRD